MCKICVFAGTTEGRELIELLVTQPAAITGCVATEYGETLLHPADNLTISAARLTEEEMDGLFRKEQFDLVVDATHPYAPIVTDNIRRACAASGTEYLRLLREETRAPEDAVFVPDIGEAVRYLSTTRGSILLTTGSKELARFTALPEFADRVYARVLPMEDSLRLCREAELPPAHILAMQGPFSREMNTAMLRAVSARYMVTKESGARGGFDQKIDAARQAGATLVVIGRPPQVEGLRFPQVLRQLETRFGFRFRPRVTVVGIGPGSRKAMTAQAAEALAEADCLIGAARMLEAAGAGDRPVCRAIAPEAIAEFIRSNPQFRRFAVVMSGDVGFFSGTKKLLPLLGDCQVTLVPGLSSLVCLCARLGTSYEDVVTVSLHGREHNILSDVRRFPRVFTLVGGENGIGRLCTDLTEAGFGHVRVSVGENLGYETEKITVGTARELARQHFASLSAALIEQSRCTGTVTHGLPDEVFLRGAGQDGVVPMTKSEVRAVCLSKLGLTADAVCWDIGAGTGSVAIEMALQAPCGQVWAIEKKPAALELLRENSARLGADCLTVVPGAAPEACRELPAPTHAFIGGSSGSMREIIALLLEKNPHVRIVATAIALETVAELTACMKEFPFTHRETVSLTVARDRKAGPYHLMTGQNPVYIFTMQAEEAGHD